MARARTIKPHFMRSRSMRAVGPMARLTFIQLWLVADDAGRIVNWRRHQKIYHPTPSRLPARPAGSRQDSGADREALGSESEKPSGDKVLGPGGENSRATREPRDSLGENPQNPCAPGLSPGFTSDSRGEGFFRRATGAVQRALARIS